MVKISLGLNYEAKSKQKLSKEFKITDDESLLFIDKDINIYIYLFIMTAFFIDLSPSNGLKKSN